MNTLLQTLETPARKHSKPWNYSACRTPVLGISRAEKFHPLEISSLRLPLIGGLHIVSVLAHVLAEFWNSALGRSTPSQVAKQKTKKHVRART